MSSVYCSKGHFNQSDHRFCAVCGEKLEPASRGVEVGMTLGDRYQIKQELGHGGFGKTYLATDRHRFSELCVLKEFAPQVRGSQALQKAKELFEREAGVLYRLQHPQIPKFRELFQVNFDQQGRLFLVQDYVEGQTYRQLLNARQQQGLCFTEPEIKQLLDQLLPVLHYIHSVGVIHRDISPDNLILRYADQLPVLIDFGGVKQVAAIAASECIQVGQVPPAAATRLGKVGYAPAEQMQSGEVSPHSDLYALGMTALVLLTGKDPQELLSLNGAWQNQVSLSQPLQTILLRMLASRPSDRFSSAAEVLRSLHTPIVEGSVPSLPSDPNAVPNGYNTPTVYPANPPIPSFHPPVATVASPPATPGRPAQRRSLHWVAILLVCLGVGAMGGTAWWMRDRWFLLLSELFLPGQTVQPGSENNANFSPQERERKAALVNRRQALGVDAKFLTQITNDTFYDRYPDQRGRTLTANPEDAEARAQWDAIASEWLDIFEQHLSAEARSQLGNYTSQDREAWKNRVNRLYVGSRSLNDLTDARFFQLFPDRHNQNFIDQPIGQVWQAIALDTVKSLEAGETLERITFARGQFSTQMIGTLSPGSGKVYIASLSEGQVMRVNLQADSNKSQLSIYVPRPTPALPFILQDSTQFVWSGRLTQSGFYEFAIVATGTESVEYRLNLAVDNITSTPIEPTNPEAPEAKD
jgi:serine/threonine-protein kinase